jgi:lipopolysaccharide export system protein LptA
MASDIGIYNEKAKIIDKENVLTSVHGFYYAGTKEFFFKDNVVLTNPKYVIKSDTLKYNTINKTAFFFGPTTITSDENLIYCENGWYNTANETSQFKKNSYINTKGQQLRGDSLLYDRKLGIGKAFNHVQIIDTAQKIIITGNIGTHYRSNQLSTVTGKALMMQRIDKDTLFMHGDTLQASFDSLKNERKLYAYHHVKMFKSDLQASCDSMSYSSIDSITRLYKDPIIWSSGNQLTADFITLQMKNKQLSNMYMYTNSFIISHEDSLKNDTTKYNQIKGKNMIGYFRDNKLFKIKVEGNGQTIYYGKNKKNKIIGVNRADCSDLWIYLEDNKLQRIVLLVKPDATFSPLKDVAPADLFLKNFKWFIAKRPKDRYSIF